MVVSVRVRVVAQTMTRGDGVMVLGQVGGSHVRRETFASMSTLGINFGRLVQNLSVDGVAVDVVQEPPEGRAHVQIRESASREITERARERRPAH